jgi:hypothetical protein
MMAGTAVAIGGMGLPGLTARRSRTAADYTDNGVTTKPLVEVNRILVEAFPEFQSASAQYPMIFPRWYDPNETTPSGDPCFLSINEVAQTHKPDQAPHDPHPVKMDYTYCMDGPLGEGYYFLLCHHAYVSLSRRLKSIAPPLSRCYFCRGKQRQALEDWFECRRVIEARLECKDKPDDGLAAKIQCEKHGKDHHARSKAAKYDWQKGLQSIQNAANIRAGL